MKRSYLFDTSVIEMVNIFGLDVQSNKNKV
jgi:hypothetical protein